MSEYLRWNPSITLGIEEIDLEHRTFVVLINRLEDVKADQEMASRVLQALVKYAAFHFQSEENIFFEAGYPELAIHHAAHLALLEQLDVVLMELRSEQIGMDQILAFFKQWYVNHTSKADHRFADFLARGPSGMAGQDASAPARSHPASPAQPNLVPLPAVWLEALTSAATRLQVDDVKRLAEETAANHPEVAQWLKSRAESHDYQEIIRAAQSALANGKNACGSSERLTVASS